MTDRLEIGTVVVLKSGGPHMTVVKHSVVDSMDHPKIECVWFKIAEGIQSVWFPDACLEIPNVGVRTLTTDEIISKGGEE